MKIYTATSSARSRADERPYVFGDPLAWARGTSAKLLLSFLFVLTACSTLAAAEATRVQQAIALPTGGSLSVDVPSNWRKTMGKPAGKDETQLTYTPAQGKSFVFSISAQAQKSVGATAPDKTELRKRVEYEADGIRLFAKEEPRVTELNAVAGPGYYFVAIDKAPARDGYELLSKGQLVVNGTVISFTVLAHQEDKVQEALSVIKRAAFR